LLTCRVYAHRRRCVAAATAVATVAAIVVIVADVVVLVVAAFVIVVAAAAAVVVVVVIAVDTSPSPLSPPPQLPFPKHHLFRCCHRAPPEAYHVEDQDHQKRNGRQDREA
jgi:hypothetical protein